MTNRTTLALLAGLLGCAAALPVQAQTLQSQLAGCLAIPGVLQRLACYDGVAKGAGIAPASRGATTPATRPAPSTYAPLAAAPIVTARPAATGMGSERIPSTVRAASNDAVTATITSLKFGPTGRFTVTFDNGEVWRQVPGDESLLHPGRYSVATITRGALGSYDMAIAGLNSRFKVTRLQ